MLKAVWHPGRIVPVLFSTFLTVGTILLCLPISRTNGDEPPNVLAAAFTAVSASCVTGLTVVDTATYWTSFGHVVIMLLIQVGGFGIMTMATLLAILVGGRLGLSQKLIAQNESHASSMGNVKAILRTVGITVAITESVIALVLGLRFYFGYGHSFGSAVWQGIFHSISAFNNAGFALFSDNLIGYAGAPFVLIPISLAIIIGGIVYMNTGGRFLKEGATDPKLLRTEEDKKRERQTLYALLVLGAIITAVIVIVLVLVAPAGGVDASLQDDGLKVDAPMVNKLIPYDQIDSVELRDDLDIGRRVGGFGGTNIRSGNFNNDEFGRYVLASYNDVPLHIVVRHSGGILAFNLSTVGGHPGDVRGPEGQAVSANGPRTAGQMLTGLPKHQMASMTKARKILIYKTLY